MKTASHFNAYDIAERAMMLARNLAADAGLKPGDLIEAMGQQVAQLIAIRYVQEGVIFNESDYAKKFFAEVALTIGVLKSKTQ